VARRIGIFLLALIAAIGLAVGGLLIWVTSESGSRYVSTRLRAVINRDTGFDMSFGDIDLELLPPRIRISSISAGDKKGAVKCSIEEAEFAPRPLDLLQGKLSIEEVYLGSPRCNVALGTQEIDALLKAFEKKDKEPDRQGTGVGRLPDFDVFAMSNSQMNLAIDDGDRIGALSLIVKGLGLDVTGGTVGIEVRGLIEGAAGNWIRGDDRFSESLEDLSFRAQVGRDAVDVRQLGVMIGGASIRLRDAHIPLPLWPQGPDVADLSVAVPLDLLNRLPLDLPQMMGTAAFLGQVSLRQERDDKVGLSARGRVTLDETFVDEFEIGNLAGLISLTPQGVAFAETEIRTADGAVHLEGNIEFDDRYSTELTARLDGIELARLLEQVKVKGSYVKQKMTGLVKLKGEINPLRLEGTTRIDVVDHTVLLGSFRSTNPPVALYVPRVSVNGKVTITDKYFEGKDLSAVTGDTRVAVDMRVDYESAKWRLHARSSDFHMEDLKKIAGFEMGGHGPVDCLITGLLWDPRIKGSASLAKFMFQGLDFDQATTDVNFYDGVLSFDGLEARRGQSRASVSELVLDFNAKSGLHLTTKIESEKVAVEDLARIFEIDSRPYGSPKGLLFGRVAIEYDLKPEYLHVDADLVHDHLEIFGERFGTDVLRLTWDNGSLTVSEFGLTKGRGTISITGAMLADRSVNFIGVASEIDSEIIDNKDFMELGIRTTGQAFVVVEGSLDSPQGWADLRMSDSVYKGIRYGPTTMNLKLDGKTLTGKGRVAGDIANVEYLKYDFDTNRFKVEGFVYDLDLVELLDFDTRDHDATLKVTGELELDGILKDDPDLYGHATIERVSMKIDDFAFENKKPMEIRAKRNLFTIKRTRFSGRDVVFDLKGTLGLESMDINVKGLADLSSVSNFTSAVDRSDGVLDFEITARGKYNAPLLRGQAELKEGVVSIAGFPHTIEKIRGQVTLTPQLIRFVGFTGRCANGTLGASGEMRIEEGSVSDYQFRLQMSELELMPFEDLTLKASTTKDGLILRSPVKGGLPKLVGDVEVRDLRYTQEIRAIEISDMDVERLTGSRIITQKPKLIDEKNDVFSFDIRLHGDRNLVARNNLFDVDFTIDDVDKPLRLVGTNQSFGFLGRILGREGQVRLYGNRFDIKYAAVDFQDPLRPENPNFRVTADGQIRDWKIAITAEGTVDDPTLNFASQPYLTREDIIFLILTRLTRTEQRQFGSTNLIVPFLGDLGPDSGSIPLEFRVFNEYSEKAGSETTRVALGRWITEDVWVSLSSSVSEENDVEANLDYKISDQFSVSAGYENDNEGNVGNLGLDLKFRLEF
jgi:hypothetical protein